MPAPVVRSRRLRILVVDDHEDSARALSLLLSRQGYDVSIAASAWGALATAAGPPVDLLVSNVRLPDLDGCELLRRLRVLSPGVYAVAVTGDDDPGEAGRCRRAGFSQFLLKPIDFGEFLDAVQDQQARLRPMWAGPEGRRDPPPSTARAHG